jgi:hypothetical protein
MMYLPLLMGRERDGEPDFSLNSWALKVVLKCEILNPVGDCHGQADHVKK